MNQTGRTSVGRRRQASRKRLVIGATRIDLSLLPILLRLKRLWALSSERRAPKERLDWTRWPVPLTKLAHRPRQSGQEMEFFSAIIPGGAVRA
jgi:hypothetical protein